MSMDVLHFTRYFCIWIGEPSDHLVARRVIWRGRITTLDEFQGLTREDLLSMHGIGPVLADRAIALQKRAAAKLTEVHQQPDAAQIERDLLEVLDTYPWREPPYHTRAHMRGVWDIAKDIWETEKSTVGKNETWTYIALMTACLLHDIGHSGGKHPDSDNVMAARDIWWKLSCLPQFDYPREVYDLVDRAIACTEFPAVLKTTNVVEKILCDADVLYTCRSHRPELVLEDLRQEMEVARKRCVDHEEMLANQELFIEHVTFHTARGLAIWQEHATTYLEEMKAYVAARICT